VTLWRKVCHLPLPGIELLLIRVSCAVFANAVWWCGWSVSAFSPLHPKCLTRVAICRVVPANPLPRIFPCRTEGCPHPLHPAQQQVYFNTSHCRLFPSCFRFPQCHFSLSFKQPKALDGKRGDLQERRLFLSLTMFWHPLGSTCAYRGLSRPERKTHHSPP